jgi:hypothetical protein
MKKSHLLIAIAATALLFNSETVSAQFGKKLISKMGSSKDGGGHKSKGGSFSSFNDEADEMGVTGEYFALKDKNTFGLRFIKEEGGKLVNKVDFYEKKSEPQTSLYLKENYLPKNQVKLFYVLFKNTYVELLELEPGVFAQITSKYNNNGNCVPPDADRTVFDVLARDKSKLATWDIETAQAKVEMIMTSLNTEKMDKVKTTLMNFDSYKNYHGKIAFAKGSNYFRNERENEPKEKLEWFITKAELGNTLAFKPYFEQPLIVSHPGAWFNITYEMAGEKTDREALRKTTTFFSKNIPLMEKDKDKFYFFYARGPIDNNGSADYAYLELLRKIKDKLKEGEMYDLVVTVWAFKDGENVAPVASGKIQMEYTKGENGTKALLFDPVKGWIPKMEKWINE